ncbi:hypothetical protein WME98_29820 [Sorangium sp. So ce296]|uniref:hypothetical protein n=1 Tax=Sorangium sp. So ce296 TaxID=3133296 RepID=UPI003F5E9EE9
MGRTSSPPLASTRCRSLAARQCQKTTLYEIVRDNVETLYGAIDDGAIAVRIPKHAKKELEAHLDCGLLCRGSRGSGASAAKRVGW